MEENSTNVNSHRKLLNEQHKKQRHVLKATIVESNPSPIGSLDGAVSDDDAINKVSLAILKRQQIIFDSIGSSTSIMIIC
jgi:hypothetical protein